jgi:hypothetical protein
MRSPQPAIAVSPRESNPLLMLGRSLSGKRIAAGVPHAPGDTGPVFPTLRWGKRDSNRGSHPGFHRSRRPLRDEYRRHCALDIGAFSGDPPCTWSAHRLRQYVLQQPEKRPGSLIGPHNRTRQHVAGVRTRLAAHTRAAQGHRDPDLSARLEQLRRGRKAGDYCGNAGGGAIGRQIDEVQPTKWLQSKAADLIASIQDLRLGTRLQIGNSVNWPFLSILVSWTALPLFGFGLLARLNTAAVFTLAIGALSVASAIFLIL